MKVRRILALVLSAALAVTALTACTSAKDEASQKSADKQTTTLSYDTVKIGVIHIGNPADGSGYTYAHDQGIVGMQKELGLKDDQIVRKTTYQTATLLLQKQLSVSASRKAATSSSAQAGAIWTKWNPSLRNILTFISATAQATRTTVRTLTTTSEEFIRQDISPVSLQV